MVLTAAVLSVKTTVTAEDSASLQTNLTVSARTVSMAPPVNTSVCTARLSMGAVYVMTATMDSTVKNSALELETAPAMVPATVDSLEAVASSVKSQVALVTITWIALVVAPVYSPFLISLMNNAAQIQNEASES